MSILNFFNRKKDITKKDLVLQANATLYPDKIIIETVDRVKEGFGISSTIISILPIHTDNETLGSKVRYHLSQTKIGLAIPKDYQQHYKVFLHKVGFKNGKEHHKDASQLMISQRQNHITISPTRNGGYNGKDRGFLGMKDADIIVDRNIDDVMLADKIKEGWTKCK